MVRLTINNITPTLRPKYGWTIGYRIKGTTGSYTQLSGIKTQPIVIETNDPEGTLYEGFIKSECEPGQFTDSIFWNIDCQCQTGFYTISNTSVDCVLQEQIRANSFYDEQYVLHSSCPSGWTLDTTLGPMNHMCKRTVSQTCNENCYDVFNLRSDNQTTNSIRLLWERPLGEQEGYRIEYKRNSSSSWLAIDVPDTPALATISYVITGLEPGNRYNFRVHTKCLKGSTSVTPEINVYTESTACPVMTNYDIYQNGAFLYVSNVQFVGSYPASYIIGYRPIGETAYKEAEVNVLPAEIPIEKNRMYQGYIKIKCVNGSINTFYWKNTCECPPDFQSTLDGEACLKYDAVSIEKDTSFVGCYKTSAWAELFPTVPYTTNITDINGNSVIPADGSYWKRTGELHLRNEMIWFDRNCNGDLDNPLLDRKFSLPFIYNNTTNKKYLYALIGSNANEFTLYSNGNVAASSLTDLGYHLKPIPLIPGRNYISFDFIADSYYGGQEVGLRIYDNTLTQLLATTNGSGLNILYRTGALKGQPINSTICNDGWVLDTTDPNNYKCVYNYAVSCTIKPNVCKEVTNIQITEISNDTIGLKWDKIFDILGYSVEYRIGEYPWTRINTTESNTVLKGLEQKSLYEIRIRTICEQNFILSKSISVATLPVITDCFTKEHVVTTTSSLPLSKTYNIGCNAGSVDLNYDILDIDIKELAQIDVLYKTNIIASKSNLKKGDSGVLKFPYNPVGDVCSVTVKTSIISPQTTQFKGTSVGSIRPNEMCRINTNTFYYTVVDVDDPEPTLGKYLYLDNLLTMVLRGEDRWYKLSSNINNYNAQINNYGQIVDITPCNPKNLTVYNNSRGAREKDTIESIEINNVELTKPLYGLIPLKSGDEIFTSLPVGYNNIRIKVKSLITTTTLNNAAKLSLIVNGVKYWEQLFDTSNSTYEFIINDVKVLLSDNITLTLN